MVVEAEVEIDSLHLAIADEIGPRLELVRGVFVWTPLLLCLLALLPGPLFTTLLSSSFERRRWSESDHDDTEEDDE